MHRGYVRLYRMILDGGLIKKHKHFAFMGWCLLKATHKPYKAYVGSQTVILQPGQFIFGRVSSADELGMTESEIRSRLAYFTRTGFLTSKTTSQFSIITIVNWGTYQNVEEHNRQQNDQLLTNDQPHTRIEEQKNNTLMSAEDPPTSMTLSCLQQEIIGEYNRILGPYLPKVILHLWKGKREKALTTRLKEKESRRNIGWWTGFFENIRDNCPFLLGSGGASWRANLEWIVTQGNFAKILEGTYHEERKGTSGHHPVRSPELERGGSDPVPGGCDEGGVDHQGQDQEGTAGGMEAAA